jgi:hypothetical protein
VEINEALAEFRASTDRFDAAFAGATDAVWVYKPAPDVYSMAETIEHVTMADRGVRGVASKALRPFAPGEHVAFPDDAFPTMFDDAGPPPPGADEPSGTWTDQTAALAQFKEMANTLAAWYESSDADLRSLTCPHPVFGLLDGVQWLLFAASHHDNHTRDVLQLRKHAVA